MEKTAVETERKNKEIEEVKIFTAFHEMGCCFFGGSGHGEQ